MRLYTVFIVLSMCCLSNLYAEESKPAANITQLLLERNPFRKNDWPQNKWGDHLIRPSFGSPNLYIDIAGASVGHPINEMHAGRIMLYSTRFKFGIGTTVFALYNTPFRSIVSDTRKTQSEKVDVFVIAPFEAAFAPINLRLFGNVVISPQLFYSYTAIGATIRSETLELGQVPYHFSFSNYGVRIPVGALIGFEFGQIHFHGDRGITDKQVSYGAINETRHYAMINFFLGGMFAIPTARSTDQPRGQ